jgi:signal transduction histidine kinase
MVTHTDDRKFDQEDERIIKTLANFAAAGWQLWKARGTAEAVATSTKHDLSRSIERESKLQEQLQHSRRMESIGTLAGGIVHDFNNLLNIVESYATLMRTDLKNPISMEQHLEVIDETVKEGTVLTQQLLTVREKPKSSSIPRVSTG